MPPMFTVSVEMVGDEVPILVFKSGSTDLIVISARHFPVIIIIGTGNSAASSGGLKDCDD